MLLSPDVFLFVNVQEWCFELYGSQSSDGRGTKLLRLMLPPLSADCHAFNLACRNSSPASSAATHDNQPQNQGSLPLGEHLPFHVSADSAVALFKFSISPDQGLPFPFILVTHRRSLLSLLSNLEARERGYIPWQEWGETLARVIPSPLDVFRATITIGQRFASIQCTGELAPIRIFDFNPFLIQRLLLNPECIESTSSVTRIVSGRDMLEPPSNTPFAGEVWSELPYVECSSKEKFDYSYVFIDEERIVGMKVRLKLLEHGQYDKY